MVRGGFRHLIVIEGADVVGILSVRDVVRCWTDDGATCDVPEARLGLAARGARAVRVAAWPRPAPVVRARAGARRLARGRRGPAITRRARASSTTPGIRTSERDVSRRAARR